MTRSEAAQALLSGATTGVVMSAILIGLIFYFGGTFGQRCAAVGFEWGTPLHAECVRLLNEGKEIQAGRSINHTDDREGE